MNKTDRDSPFFLVTKEHRRFEEFCNACRRHRYVGLCYGAPGVGKTLSARHYARWDMMEGRDPLDGSCPVPRELAECRTLFYTAPVTNSPRQVKDDITEGTFLLRGLVGKAETEPGEQPHYRDCCELIIVDEADRLKMPALEQLRDMYDQGDFGLILIGMPGFEKRLARYAQLYSRVGFAHAFRPLGKEEMDFILEHHWKRLGCTLDPDDFTDQEAVSAIFRTSAGNFRLLQRLFSQVERIMKLNSMQSVTKEIVEAARECIVVGAV